MDDENDLNNQDVEGEFDFEFEEEQEELFVWRGLLFGGIGMKWDRLLFLGGIRMVKKLKGVERL